MKVSNVSSCTIATAAPGSLLLLNTPDGVTWAIALKQSDTGFDRLLTLPEPGVSGTAPTIRAVPSDLCALSFGSDFTLDVAAMPSNIATRVTEMERSGGALSVLGTTLRMYAGDERDRLRSVVRVNLSDWTVDYDMGAYGSVEVRAWVIRLPSLTPGVPGRVVSAWPASAIP